MPDRAPKNIARIVAQGGLSAAEARAAMRLVSVAESAIERRGPGQSISTCIPGYHCPAVNRNERQVIGRIADRRLFEAWQAEMRERGGDAGVTIDVLLLGETLSAVDRRMKRRKGWARGEVRRGISAFHEILAQRGDKSNLDKPGHKEYQIG